MYKVSVYLSAKRFAKPDHEIDVDAASFEGAAANAMRRLALSHASFIATQLSEEAKAGFSSCDFTEIGFSYYRRSF